MPKTSPFLSMAGLAVAGLLATSATTFAGVNLPPGEVAFYADGADHDAFFHVRLSGVPAGYDVSDGVYSGYCVSYYDTQSPTGAWHPAILADSTSTTLPPEFQMENWDKVNYVLNHKQGVADDVQAAIWFFTDNVTWELTPAARLMVDDALANGEGFQPGPGQKTAAILQATDNLAIQTLIIEVTTPTPPVRPCDDFVTGGGWILTGAGAKANFGVHGGIRNGGYWGGLNYVDHGTGLHVKSTAVLGYEHLGPLTRRITYSVTAGNQSGTAVVTVTDNGEPGTRDRFEIQLSWGYREGGELGGTAKRGGGGNIQLHKAKCDGNRGGGKKR